MVSTDTAHGCQLSPARQQIVNHLNCSAASLSGHNAINPPTTTLVPSKKNTDQELLSSGHIFAPLSSNARDLSKGIEATRSHTMQDWGLSVAVNYPLMLPAQTPGFANVLQAPFNQGSPRIDWSMALIAKTNFTTPFPTRWAPWGPSLAQTKVCVQKMSWNIHDMWVMKPASPSYWLEYNKQLYRQPCRS